MRQLGLEGKVTFSLGFDSFKLNVERVANNRSGGKSGTLWIKLWARHSRAREGRLQGALVGCAQLEPLAGGQSIAFERTLGYADLPPGTYYPAVTLEELDSSTPSGRVVMDLVAFDDPVYFGKPLLVTAPSACFEEGISTIRVEAVENPTTRETGPLRITAVETLEPYAGGPIRGMRLGSREFVPLAAGQAHRDITWSLDALAGGTQIVLLFEERPTPSTNWHLCDYWSGAVVCKQVTPNEEIHLKDLVGQAAAKRKLHELIQIVAANEERKRRGLRPQDVSLHAVFTGNPGTGKTTFARFYAQEIRKLGILKRGHMIEVSRAQLVAEYEGQTASKTAKAIESAFGGVLFIDEAYSLKARKDDRYGQECVDTLNKMMEDNRHQLAVVFAGYTDETREFLRCNQGLESRIASFNVVAFDDFTDSELGEILTTMCRQRGLVVDDCAQGLAIEEVARGRAGRSFGNARDVRNVLERAIARQAVRLGDAKQASDEELKSLDRNDFTGGDDPVTKNSLERILDFVGLEAIKRDFCDTADLVRLERTLGKAGGLSTVTLHRLFAGGPGTGKRSVARLYSSMLRELGLLASGHMVEVSRSDLIASYLGQTVEKTRDRVRDALGGVLYLKDAPALWQATQNGYDRDAIDTLLDAASTQRNRLALVFGGDMVDIQQLLAREPRIRQLFPTLLEFAEPNLEQLMEIAVRMAKADGAIFGAGALAQLCARIAAARADRTTFSNANSLRELLQRAYLGRARRLRGHPELNRLEREVLQTVGAGDFD